MCKNHIYDVPPVLAAKTLKTLGDIAVFSISDVIDDVGYLTATLRETGRSVTYRLEPFSQFQEKVGSEFFS